MSQEKRQRETEGAADRFLDLVDGSGFLESVDFRFCAFRSGRRWVNLVTRGFLDHRTPRSVPRLSAVDRPEQPLSSGAFVRRRPTAPLRCHGELREPTSPL